MREDAGTYRCTTNNGYGGDVHEDTALVVHCKYAITDISNIEYYF